MFKKCPLLQRQVQAANAEEGKERVTAEVLLLAAPVLNPL